MKSYIHYVHDIRDNQNSWLLNGVNRRKSVNEFRKQLNSINELQQAILKESNTTVFNFLSEHLDLSKYFRHIIFSTDTKTYADDVDFNNVRAIINFKKINTIRQFNEHFLSVNKLLPDAGIYIGRFESYHERKLRFYKYFGRKAGRLIWLMDFIFNRALPKIRPINKVYNFIFQQKHHVISQAEILGRLVYNGFEIIEYQIIDGLVYFVVIKTKEPSNDPEPTYYPLIRLNRVGKNGKMIKVYKFRTMYPYSEYLQDFVLKLNGYNRTGKPAKDFRVAGWGKIIRKLWIDELPQILNVFNGEMRLIGVRPLSRVRFRELPPEIRERRIKHKPGCFPPYVALNMPDNIGNIDAEKIYLDEKDDHPVLTDIKYFFMSIFNIVTNKIRSS